MSLHPPSFLSYLRGDGNDQELQILSNDGAGACFFRAIAQHQSVFGDEREHFSLRKCVGEHILTNWNSFRSFFSSEYSQEDFR